MDVGEKIRHLRRQKGWSQKQLGDLIGVDNSTISQYETYMRTPSCDVLIRLCQVFQVSADYFLDLHTANGIQLSAEDLTESQVSILIGLSEEFRKANRAE